MADYHSYFVGHESWGFDLWAHNANYGLKSTQPLPLGAGGNYQKYTTGTNSDAVYWYRNAAGKLREVQVDGLRRGWVIEAKFAGKNFASSRYLTKATAETERKLRVQMVRLLEFAQAKGVNGVKLYTTNEAVAQYFLQVYERNPVLLQAIQAGIIQIVVKGFPN